MSRYKSIVLVGPSATGKTATKDLLEAQGHVRYGVTCTTRPMRTGEFSGLDYDFLTVEEWDILDAMDELAERTEYISNKAHRYGILRKRIEEAEQAELPTLWILDTRGLAWMRDHFGKENVLAIALTAGREVLRRRLLQRDGQVGSRLDKYIEELVLAINACDQSIDTSRRSVERVAEIILSMMGVKAHVKA